MNKSIDQLYSQIAGKETEKPVVDIENVFVVLYKPMDIYLYNDKDTRIFKTHSDALQVTMDYDTIVSGLLQGSMLDLTVYTKEDKTSEIDNVFAFVTVGSKTIYEYHTEHEIFFSKDGKRITKEDANRFVIAGTIIPFIWYNKNRHIVSTVGDVNGVKRLVLPLQRIVEVPWHTVEKLEYLGVDNDMIYRESVRSIIDKLISKEYFAINETDSDTAIDFVKRASARVRKLNYEISELKSDILKINRKVEL